MFLTGTKRRVYGLNVLKRHKTKNGRKERQEERKMKPKAKTFKELVRTIHEMDANSSEDRNRVVYEIDWAFQQEKITGADLELLIDLACMVRIPAKGCRLAG